MSDMKVTHGTRCPHTAKNRVPKVEMQQPWSGKAGSSELLKGHMYKAPERNRDQLDRWDRQRQEVKSYSKPLAHAIIGVGWENPIHRLAWTLQKLHHR